MHKCDIIMVCWNQPFYTRRCIESILKYTDLSSRLIIVDNGSNPETITYLKSLTPTNNIEIEIIYNYKNVGAIKARNQGLRLFDAEYLCFIDNDIEVGPQWLSRMTNLFKENPEIGIINPSSNNFGEYPPKGMNISEYAASLGINKGKYIEVGQCISFCMVIKKEVVDKVGYLDEDFDIMFYEDTDYSMRSNKEGYICVISRSVYVWHYGHRTSKKVPKEIYEKNKNLFYKKWGRPLRIAWMDKIGYNTERFRQALICSIELARDGNFVYLHITDSPESKEQIFDIYDLIPHANIHIYFCRNKLFNLYCLWRLLKKRKKRYDLAIIPNADMQNILTYFRFLHNVDITAKTDFGDLIRIVHKKKKFI